MAKKVYNWLKTSFGFTRSQSNGFAVLLLLLIVVIFTPAIVRSVYDDPQPLPEDIENWNRFQKLLDAQRISADSLSTIEKKFVYDNPPPKKKWSNQITIDLNLADTTDLKQIRGIGTVLSKRIIKYREALGGFHNPNQLLEVYGLDSTVALNAIKNNITSKNHTVNQLDLRTSDFRTLLKHPYLGKPHVHAIISYLELNDSLSISGLVDQNPDLNWESAVPYLSFSK